MNDIDALTLKLLTSKRRYNNYLATANPEKSTQIQEYYAKVRKSSGRIKQLIGKYLDNPETETSNEIDELMETCFKTLLKHFDMQDFEDKCAKHNFDAVDTSSDEEEEEEGDEVNDEEVFNEVNEDLNDEKEDKVEDKNKTNASASFWGKNVTKTKGMSSTLATGMSSTLATGMSSTLATGMSSTLDKFIKKSK
jgi:hypothetical protein